MIILKDKLITNFSIYNLDIIHSISVYNFDYEFSSTCYIYKDKNKELYYFNFWNNYLKTELYIKLTKKEYLYLLKYINNINYIQDKIKNYNESFKDYFRTKLYQAYNKLIKDINNYTWVNSEQFNQYQRSIEGYEKLIEDLKSSSNIVKLHKDYCLFVSLSNMNF